MKRAGTASGDEWRAASRPGNAQGKHDARRRASRERLRGDDFVTGSVRSSKRAEHAHAAVASQSRRGGRGSRFPHFVALIRFERIARARRRRVVPLLRMSFRLPRCVLRHATILDRDNEVATWRDERKRQTGGLLSRDSSVVRGSFGVFQKRKWERSVTQRILRYEIVGLTCTDHAQMVMIRARIGIPREYFSSTRRPWPWRQSTSAAGNSRGHVTRREVHNATDLSRPKFTYRESPMPRGGIEIFHGARDNLKIRRVWSNRGQLRPVGTNWTARRDWSAATSVRSLGANRASYRRQFVRHVSRGKKWRVEAEETWRIALTRVTKLVVASRRSEFRGSEAARRFAEEWSAGNATRFERKIATWPRWYNRERDAGGGRWFFCVRCVAPTFCMYE